MKSRPRLFAQAIRTGDRLRRLRLRLAPGTPSRPSHALVAAFARERPRASFVQIGAHDGTQLDPLRWAILATDWHGVLVEPVPYVFERLRLRYGGCPRLQLENVAVSTSDEPMSFFYVPETGDDVWNWYDALGSFRRDVVLSHTEFIEDIAERVEEMTVPCATFDQVCDRNGLVTVDVVQVDTEGFDLTILESIDLDRYRPAIVMIEELHLSDDEKGRARQLVTEHGYEWFADGMDLVSVRSEVLRSSPALRRQFDDAVEFHRSAQDDVTP